MVTTLHSVSTFEIPTQAQDGVTPGVGLVIIRLLPFSTLDSVKLLHYSFT